MTEKIFGINPDNRATIPDAKRASGFGATQEPYQYINQALFELKCDHVIGTAAQLSSGSCTCKYQSSDQTLRDGDGNSVTLTNGDRVLIIGLDTLTADFDLSAYDRLNVIVDSSISLANGTYNLDFGDECVLDLHVSTAANITVGSNCKGWVNHDLLFVGKLGVGVLPGDMSATGFEVAAGLTVSLDGATVINESGNAVDFRVEGDSMTHLLFCDGSADKIGINTSSPAQLLHLKASGAGGTGYPMIRIEDTDTAKTPGEFLGGVEFYGNDATGTPGIGASILGVAELESSNGDSTGLVFYTGVNASAAEKMRLTHKGQLLVGETDPPNDEVFYVAGTVSDNVAGIFLNSSAANSTVLTVQSNYVAADTTHFLVQSDGDCQNTNNSYGAVSDISLKENIVDATPKLEDIMDVRIRNFSFKNNPGYKQIGVIAQELEEVFPGLVKEGEDGIKSVKYSVLSPILIKAFQEFVEETRNRLDTLEG